MVAYLRKLLTDKPPPPRAIHFPFQGLGFRMSCIGNLNLQFAPLRSTSLPRDNTNDDQRAASVVRDVTACCGQRRTVESQTRNTTTLCPNIYTVRSRAHWKKLACSLEQERSIELFYLLRRKILLIKLNTAQNFVQFFLRIKTLYLLHISPIFIG